MLQIKGLKKKIKCFLQKIPGKEKKKWWRVKIIKNKVRIQSLRQFKIISDENIHDLFLNYLIISFFSSIYSEKDNEIWNNLIIKMKTTKVFILF